MSTPHVIVLETALALVRALEPACSEVQIAGSLRRGKPEVKDIEIVVCLLEDRPVHLARHTLSMALYRLTQDGTLKPDPEVKRNGDKYKRFLVNDLSADTPSLAVDLFIAERANFGNIFAIRTGDAEFSRLMMTCREWGGFMPPKMEMRDGFLQQYRGTKAETYARIDCPTEEAFFAALGLPTLPPEQRNLEGVQKLRAHLAHPLPPLAIEDEHAITAPWRE